MSHNSRVTKNTLRRFSTAEGSPRPETAKGGVKRCAHPPHRSVRPILHRILTGLHAHAAVLFRGHACQAPNDCVWATFDVNARPVVCGQLCHDSFPYGLGVHIVSQNSKLTMDCCAQNPLLTTSHITSRASFSRALTKLQDAKPSQSYRSSRRKGISA